MEARDPTSLELLGTSRRGGYSQTRRGLWQQLVGLRSTVEVEVRRMLREHFDTTMPQFNVLVALHRAARPLTMSQLAAALLVSNGNLTGVVARLERAGLIRSTRIAADRRVHRVRLTAEGAAQFARITRVHEQLIAEAFGRLSQRDLQLLQSLLSRAYVAATLPTPHTRGGQVLS